MPTERVSRGFKDISLSFQYNPLTRDVIAIKNETAIARSLRNLVLTQIGEKFFDSRFGSRVSGLLFENVNEVTAGVITSEIDSVIRNNEPRVNLTNVIVVPNYDEGAFNVVIEYAIIGLPLDTQQLTFVLTSTR